MVLMNNDLVENTYQKMLINAEKTKSIMDFMTGKKQFDDKLPISIELHLTNRCNLKCEWCVDKPIRQNQDLLTWETLQTFIQDIAWQGVGLTIEGGGEPTLYYHFNEFVYECKEKGIHLGLITNGVKMLPDDVVRCFDWIRVSLDATNREEYIAEKGVDYFDKVVSNIYRIAEIAPDVVLNVSYVITKRNATCLINLFDLFAGISIDCFRIRTVEEHPELMITPEIAEDLYRLISEEEAKRNIHVVLSMGTDLCKANDNLPCVAHSIRAIIHADGNVVLCEKRRHDIITLGNITQNRFKNIWFSDAHKKAADKLKNSANQSGCEICRVTKFNQIFCKLNDVKTTSFI